MNLQKTASDHAQFQCLYVGRLNGLMLKDLFKNQRCDVLVLYMLMVEVIMIIMIIDDVLGQAPARAYNFSPEPENFQHLIKEVFLLFQQNCEFARAGW